MLTHAHGKRPSKLCRSASIRFADSRLLHIFMHGSVCMSDIAGFHILFKFSADKPGLGPLERNSVTPPNSSTGQSPRPIHPRARRPRPFIHGPAARVAHKICASCQIVAPASAGMAAAPRAMSYLSQRDNLLACRGAVCDLLRCRSYDCTYDLQLSWVAEGLARRSHQAESQSITNYSASQEQINLL